MRGHVSPQSHLFSYFSPEERVPATHLLRSIKAYSDAALALLARQRRKHLQPVSIGADKGYHRKQFVSALKAKHIRPHIACIEGRRTAGLDQRTLGSPAYRARQIVRKRIEQFFGWGKTTGGLRKTRLHGVERNAQLLWLIGSAYNLLRMSRM